MTRWWRLGVGLILLALLAWLLLAWLGPPLMPDDFVQVLIVLAVNAVLVSSLGLSNGFTGVFSLEHVGFVALGVYGSAILTLGLDKKIAYLPDLPGWLSQIQLGFLPAILVAGLLCVLNISEQVKADPDYRPALADLEAWEDRHSRVPEGSFVTLRTDWYRRWPDRDRMANADAGGVAHFPGWSREVLEALLEERGVTAVGHENTDTDGGISSARDGDYSLEAYILGRDCWQLELLANLDNVPEVGALLLASWPNPKGGSGFPARAVAIHGP